VLQSTAAEWQNVFLVGGGLYMGTAVIFILFGSGHVQKWNDILDEVKMDDITIKKDVPNQSS